MEVFCQSYQTQRTSILFTNLDMSQIKVKSYAHVQNDPYMGMYIFQVYLPMEGAPTDKLEILVLRVY